MHVEVRCVYRGTIGIKTETDTVVERERKKHYNQRVSVKGETKGTGGIEGSGDMTAIAVDGIMAKKKLLRINTVQ